MCKGNDLVSIIITLYNYEEYICDCINSCLCQSYKPIEVIVVNDCSTDGSLKRVCSVPIPQNINFEVISHDKNRGFSEAKNTGIKKAIGKYITFIDADDMLTPESVEVRVKAFDDTVNFVHGNVYDVVNCSLSYCECVKNRKVFERSDGTKRYFTKEHKNKIHAQSMMFRKTVFDKFGLYWNINSKADKEMTYRLGLHPLSPLPALVKKKKINDFVAFYRRHPESMKSGLDKKEKQALKNRFDARIKQLQKEGITHDNTPFH